ncbi:MAG: 4Fe-4S binding protein [Bacteroidales bacterium]|nr:4Fe-4S binding protein [Bacteroidales bacterium]
MIRDVVKIDEELCDGCGLCVPGCHEGALQVIDGKARLISDLMCDGLGACIGQCPQGAITIEKREAEPYNETKVMAIMVQKGKNTVIAHMKHLKEHSETGFLKEAVKFLNEHSEELDFDHREVIAEVHGHHGPQNHHHEGGCPGSRPVTFEPKATAFDPAPFVQQSELRQWPVQMHLINPNAPYFRNTDVLIAADCTAFSMGDFHSRHLKGKSLAIACPKLDSNTEVYIEKIRLMIDEAKVNTLTVMIMQVPCCMGLLQMVKTASSRAQRKVPVKLIITGLEGNILNEEWI